MTCVKCGQLRKRSHDGRYHGGLGMCTACYSRARRNAGGPLGEPREPVPGTCRECGEPTDHHSAKGRCGRCYQRWRRSWQDAGSPPPPAGAQRPALRSGWYGYSPATGTARLEAAS